MKVHHKNVVRWVMETTNTSTWTQVAEIELVYKSKVKASERPKVTTHQMLIICLNKVGTKTKFSLLNSLKCCILTEQIKF